MDASDIGFVLTTVGLIPWLAFCYTARFGSVGLVGRVLSPLIVPVAIAALWRIALDLHWWTIAVFFLASVTTATFNAFVMRFMGKATLFAAQSFNGLLGLGCVVLGWVIWFVAD